MSDPLVAVYADESCLGNGKEGENPGGAGVLVEYQTTGGTLRRHDLWVSAPATTNNQMALRSVIEACRALSAKGRTLRIVFTTDSRYIVDGMTSWVHAWARNGWKRKTGPIENLALWQDALRAAAPHAIAWRWVRGHDGHAQNEYVNYLAIRGAEQQTASGGLITSGFDDWVATAGKKGSRLDPFPATFVASSRLPQV
jgi:ribonuclease HI